MIVQMDEQTEFEFGFSKSEPCVRTEFLEEQPRSFSPDQLEFSL